MQNWIIAVILGVIEGVTEFLPVSSTGHLIIAEQILPRHPDLFNDVFNVVIQSAAVLAVLFIFKDRVKQLLFQWRDPAVQSFFLKLFAAFFITGVGGIVLKKLHFRLPESAIPVAWATLIGGVLFIGVERWLKNRQMDQQITWAIAVMMGLSQLFAAVFPGTSRSGITILIALAMGLARPAAAEFSFLLGVPTLMAAGALQAYGALKVPDAAPQSWNLILIASLASLITSFIVVKWLLRFIQHHTFESFGWYRIALGIAILLMAFK